MMAKMAKLGATEKKTCIDSTGIERTKQISISKKGSKWQKMREKVSYDG